MTRNDFLKVLGLGVCTSLPLVAAQTQQEKLDERESLSSLDIKSRLIAIADCDLYSSHLFPLRFQRAPIEMIKAGSLVYICINDEPRAYKLERFDAPEEFWYYRICLCDMPETPNSFVRYRNRVVTIYTTAAILERRAVWWESKNNHAAAQADRNFAKLIRSERLAAKKSGSIEAWSTREVVASVHCGE